MSGFRGVLRSISFSSSPPSNKAPMPRQEATGRYLPEEMLQKFLEAKFPNHPKKDFHIKVHEDLLAFDAPEEISEDELERLSSEAQRALLVDKKKQIRGKGLESHAHAGI